MKNHNVITEIVNRNLCIGCGLCAALCPTKNLTIKWNAYGEYNPVEDGNCLKTCTLCMKVCPFAGGNFNEDQLGKKLFGDIPGINHRTETGYYIASYVGYSHNRDISASGGVATYLLERLLAEDMVDQILCVAPTENPETLFRYFTVNRPEDISKSAGSVYYPTTLSEGVRHIIDQPGRYAVTALPCVAKALRLAAMQSQTIQQRIRYLLGLTCGQMKSAHYTRYIAHLAGIDEPLRSCSFRKKSPDQPANNYAFSCEDVNGNRGEIRWNEGVSQVWSSRAFTPFACNYCDDIFAELADITFMDAWLPDYLQDSKGTSLVLLRNPELEHLLTGTRESDITLKEISINSVIQSQTGVIHIKRQDLGHRLSEAIQEGQEPPPKRIIPQKKHLNALISKQENITRKIQTKTRQTYIKNGKYKIEIKTLLKILNIIRKINRFADILTNTCNKIPKILNKTRSRP